MRFTPKTKEEIEEERLIPEGEYSFEITESVEYTSKSGNEMFKMFVTVYKPDGKFIQVIDYVGPQMMYKLLHLCEATGLEDEYHQGALEADFFKGKTGTLKLGIQKSDDYPDKNTIKDYLPDEEPKKKRPPTSKEIQKPLDDDMEDEIPF